MLILGVILLVVFLVVIPGLLLVLGLARAADGPAPAPEAAREEAATVESQVCTQVIVFQSEPWRERSLAEERREKAGFN